MFPTPLAASQCSGALNRKSLHERAAKPQAAIIHDGSSFEIPNSAIVTSG